jgi:hypothetical protein
LFDALRLRFATAAPGIVRLQLAALHGEDLSAESLVQRREDEDLGVVIAIQVEDGADLAPIPVLRDDRERALPAPPDRSGR